jgi:hypothetical protein
MPKTMFGTSLKTLGGASKNSEFHDDLDKISKIPIDPLKELIRRIAEIHPCNIYEVAEVVGAEAGIDDHRALSDVAAAVMYVVDSTEDDEAADVASDLVELGFIGEESIAPLVELLGIANQLREKAGAIDAYRQIGAPVLDDVRGTVDLRCQFHRTREDYVEAAEPKEIVEIRPIIVVDIVLRNQNQERLQRVSFQMDEHDLRTMKRFVRNMETALKLATPILTNTRT